MNRIFWKRIFLLSLIIFLVIPDSVLADLGLADLDLATGQGQWRVIWEGSFTLNEPAGAYQGYFLADEFYGNWPNGFLRREIHVTYLDGDDSAGGVISFHVIRFPLECGWSEWSVGSYLTSPEWHHWDTDYFETSPNGVGIVYRGQSAGRCHAKVNMKLLAPVYGKVEIPWIPHTTNIGSQSYMIEKE